MKPGLELLRLIEIESELQVMRNRLTTLFVEISSAYPFQGNKSGTIAGKQIDKAIVAIDMARASLDLIK